MKTTLLVLLVTAAIARATIVQVTNDETTRLRGFDGNPLTNGLTSGNDGAVLQLGFYDQASLTDLFAGEWVPLTGEGSNNGYLTTIGNGLVDAPGRFGFSVSFGGPETSNNLPATGTPLALRFYDGVSIGGSLHFNAVSTAAWTWDDAPFIDDRLTFSLTNPGLRWQGGRLSEFETTLVVPEAPALALLVAGMLPRWRRGAGKGR